ncbi:CamS family sex pheromone protein [Edaphobacillus lindanitolerans]|uniref:Protein involved in sex pheromone biosynthesis n=1 Tax=Edaphobacillus lindanitolerans TaxID=550447 RepID=A0A1U7PQK3_9BACI|nr:CamS family sex pheromone protein [Edaphobacillus lindanitolerans]SIT92923.1 Protein involved in sex pheromone biosynthesis [Edaphobacillus lindanitolerans]
MKIKLITAAALSAVLLSGCLPAKKEPDVVNNPEQETEQRVIIPNMQLSDEYYRTLLPYKKSASRGLVVNNLNSKYNVIEAESGLMRLSHRKYPTEDFFFQEGQYLDEKTVRSWLAHKSEDYPEGLNPQASGSAEETRRKVPVYVAHIIEQNYLKRTSEDKIRLEGISIGIALNSVNTTEGGGAIPQKKIEEEGKKAAAEVVKRMRKIEGLAQVPIVVGLYRQSSKNDISPGSYFAVSTAEKGKDVLSGWDAIDEEYVIFPTSTNADKYRDMDTKFRNFKQDVDKYFSSFVNVIGTGFYQNGTIASLKIDVPIEFYGEAEVIGFTQHLSGLVVDHFPATKVEVSVTSVNGPVSVIVKEPGSDEPYTHIYGN